MAASDHETGTVIGQIDVGIKTNEITRLDTLLETLGDLDGKIITINAVCPYRHMASAMTTTSLRSMK